MPIYEYQCHTCGERFDKLVRNLNKPPKIICPACQGENVQRLISQVAVRGGEGGNPSSETTDVADTAPTKPPVFGRKELQAAQEKKRQLREKARYGD